ncbi:MAG TPA: hypothetical protein VMY05_01575 [Acidobacteriota bacterium]|nr:hypothetical protein [Acidobacteriota bacterium]
MRKIHKFFFVTLVISVTFACTSRYRLDLYMVTGEFDKKVKIENTEYVQAATIRDPFADVKLQSGDGSCLILSIGTRGERLEVDRSQLLGYDEYFRCLLYLQLPRDLRPDTIVLENNSFAHVIGRYDQPPEEKIFLADSGTLVLDSLPKKLLFGTINGEYRNRTGETFRFNGRFKVRVTR